MSRADYDLILGALSTVANDYEGDFTLEVLGEDVSMGNAAPLSEVYASLLRDGDLTRTNRFGNREAGFRVQITASDPVGLAGGEALLMAELDKPNTLTWHVPFAAPTVFDVVRSWSEFLFDDLDELRIVRTFRIVLECLPFARSVAPVTLNWTTPATELNACTSLTGWTVVSGSADINDGTISTASSVRLSKTVTVDDYLWIKVKTSGGVTATDALTVVTVGGVSVDQDTIRREDRATSATYQIYTIPTAAWRGQSVEVAFTLDDPTGPSRSWLREFWTTSYPAATTPADVEAVTRPLGVGVIDVIGSARAPVTLSFTAPTGGAFVYTAPDPNVSIRERGAAEMLFATFTVTDPDGDEFGVGTQLMWFPPGTHATNIGVTAPQPLELNPSGVWPTQRSGTAAGVTAQWAYPVDPQAATAFFETSGAKNIVSPSASLPEGYHSAAVHFEVLSLHPGRCGFAVLDINGNPVATTITYYPHWWHHAGQ